MWLATVSRLALGHTGNFPVRATLLGGGGTMRLLLALSIVGPMQRWRRAAYFWSITIGA